jgi:hypothetical protein
MSFKEIVEVERHNSMQDKIESHPNESKDLVGLPNISMLFISR